MNLLNVVFYIGIGATYACDYCDYLLTAAETHAEETLSASDMANLNHGSANCARCKAIKNYLNQNGGENCPTPCDDVCLTAAPYGGTLESTCYSTEPMCNCSAIYRTYDGSCNNLNNLSWGRAGSPQKRIVDNAYDDHHGTPRTEGYFGELPSARTVSNMLHRADDMLFEPDLSYMVMQVGQFMTHDIILTKTFSGKDCEGLECCGKDAYNDQCFPIYIPYDDPYYQRECMTFSRSMAKTDCNGVRQQINSQTAYLDLSQVYGTSKEEALLLRTLTAGHLKNTLGKLPPDFSSPCRLDQPFDLGHFYCTKAGDPRTDEQPGLASIHTLFMAYHNIIADGLLNENPAWDDEKLFQEARKIMIGVWQNIIYTEYLPAILRDGIIGEYDLEIKQNGYNENYDDSCDATIINGFGAGAMRIGHSQIHSSVSMVNEQQTEIITPEKLEDHFLRPNLYHSQSDQGHQHILRWTASTACPLTDRHGERSVNDLLFVDNNGKSFDIFSFNIQRSSDHGNPGYNAYRWVCDLSQASTFSTGLGGLVDHEPEVADLLSNTYDHPDDIDILTGILTEKRSPGSVVGPLGECLIATQFRNLKHGDRFFFTREQHGFTPAQLNEVRKMTLSSIMCAATTTTHIQENIFKLPTSLDYVPCDMIPKLNFDKWKQN